MSERTAKNPAEMYEQYFVPGIFARWSPVLLEYANPQPGERVLDVACGTGVVTRHLTPLIGEDGIAVGVDISSDMLAIARSLPPPPGAPIVWRQGDAADLPDGPFDLVVCQRGLQFFPDRTAAATEMHRVLAPGGRAALSVWQELAYQPVYAALCEAEASYLNTSIDTVAGPAFSLGSADQLHDVMQEGGFERVEITPVSHTARFTEPEQFVMLTALASAAVVPEFSKMDETARADLVVAVSREIAPTLREYTEGDEVAFPMQAHIVIAYA